MRNWILQNLELQRRITISLSLLQLWRRCSFVKLFLDSIIILEKNF